MADQLTLWPQVRPPPSLRWSWSRDRRLQECPRLYYWYHFGSRGGGRPDAPPLARQAHALKQLRNRFMWVGEVVHEQVERALADWQRGREVTTAALIRGGVRTMREQYRSSQRWAAACRGTGVLVAPPLHEGRRACALVEHAYEERLPAGVWHGLRQRLERCLRTFATLPLVGILRALPAWRRLALEATRSFVLDGATIVVKPDVAYRAEDGATVLVDWKSGARHPAGREQLGVYGLLAERAWALGSTPLRAALVYLDGGEVDTFEVDADALAAAEAAVRASVARMRALQARVPPPIAAFVPAPAPARCGRCAFRRICDASAAP